MPALPSYSNGNRNFTKLSYCIGLPLRQLTCTKQDTNANEIIAAMCFILVTDLHQLFSLNLYTEHVTKAIASTSECASIVHVFKCEIITNN